MIHKAVRPFCLLTVLVAALLLAQPATAGQTSRSTSASSVAQTVPRTPWGDPDLQGMWDNGTITPIERPSELADTPFLTEEEVAAREQRAEQNRFADRTPRAGDVGTYNRFWSDGGTRVVPGGRTSLIVDPPDGRIPPLTPEAITQAAVLHAVATGRTVDEARQNARVPSYAAPESFDTGERCITDGLPYLPGPYNNNYLVMQTPEHVAIYYEMYHDLRIIPVDRPSDRRSHVAQHISHWLGDARGHWDGDTLVVETTNFKAILGRFVRDDFNSLPGEDLRLVERFTRIDADTLTYEFTMEDRTTWSRPWTGTYPFTRTENEIYEFACHEGNYAVPNALSGSRAQERTSR